MAGIARTDQKATDRKAVEMRCKTVWALLRRTQWLDVDKYTLFPCHGWLPNLWHSADSSYLPADRVLGGRGWDARTR